MSFQCIGLDVGYAILQHLSIEDVLSFSASSKACNHLVTPNVSLWQHFCAKDYNVLKTDLNTTSIGLARNALSWREYYVLVSSSDVLTWGLGGRTGHQEDKTPFPRLLPELGFQGIHTLGKTAEVGSIALSRSGKVLFCWGTYAQTRTPKKVSFLSFSASLTDRILHCSCGHDSGFLLVSEQGEVYFSKQVLEASSWQRLSFRGVLSEGERPLWSIGSQSNFSAVVTNRGRVIWWTPYGEKDRRYVIEPIDPTTGKRFKIVKTGFGHREMGVIDEEGKLFTMRYEKMEWQLRWTASRVVDFDSGSHHSAFVTADGEVYTYGKGYLGMLGHGNEEWQTNPKRVEWFASRGWKVVAVGCGGHISGNGSFTLYLLSDNRLFYSGQLGGRDHQYSEPKEILSSDLEGRHILSISAGEDWAGVVVSGKPKD